MSPLEASLIETMAESGVTCIQYRQNEQTEMKFEKQDVKRTEPGILFIVRLSSLSLSLFVIRIQNWPVGYGDREGREGLKALDKGHRQSASGQNVESKTLEFRAPFSVTQEGELNKAV
jgi:hypothetical protein